MKAGMNAQETEALFAELAEMPAPPCDGERHGTGVMDHDDGPGKHYFMMTHDCYVPKGTIVARCERKSQHILGLLRVKTICICTNCSGVFVNREDWMKYVGPIGKV